VRTDAATPESSRRRAGLIVALLALGIWAACFRFPVVWNATGIGEAGRPFLDLYGLLAASDAAQAGTDPFQPNAFDPYHRPLLYTEWWLGAGKLGLTRADTGWLGWVMAGATLLAAIAMIQPRTRGEQVKTLLWLASPAMLMAINRANNDLVVFLVMSAGLLSLRAENWPWRALGVVLFAAAAVLKYYPLAGLVVLLDARTRSELAGAVALYALVVLLAWPPLAAGLASAARSKPSSEWLYAFGAPVLFRDLGFRSAAGWVVLAVGLGAGTIWSVRKSGALSVGDETHRVREREFVVGAALLAGCFFLGASYVYKLVFAAWLFPWLWRNDSATENRHWRLATWWLLVGVLWLEGFMAVVINVLVTPLSRIFAERLLTVALVTSQLLTWSLVACLLRCLLSYVLRCAHAARVQP
jgi:hypothetical protein